MGRTVVAEKYLESEVKSLVASGAKYGLILGQVRSNSDSGDWLVGCGLSTISAVDQVLTGTLTLFQATRER